MDRECIENSVMKTKRIVTVEDGYPFCGIGAEIISMLMEGKAFDYLDAWPEWVSAWDVPLSYAKNLEHATLP